MAEDVPVAACLQAVDGALTVAFADGPSVRLWHSGSGGAELGTTDSAITSIALDAAGARVVTVNDKTLTVWDVSQRRALWRTVVGKRPATVVFDGARVLLADKFGEVWTLTEDATRAETADAAAAIASGPEPQFQTGVVSPISAMILSAARDRLVTADSDRRIRVSLWPDAYQIEAFCMGSKSTPTVLAFACGRELLLSGGEDGSVHAWHPTSGALLALARPASDLPPSAPAGPGAAAEPSAAVRALCATVGGAKTIVAVALAAGAPRVQLYSLEQLEGDASLRACGVVELTDARGSVCKLHSLANGSLLAVCAGRQVFQLEPSEEHGMRLAGCHYI
ncbi:hypothetical protein T492DRAFT_875686 [Pavlovales sp. CCMP2436]|nr:hypothetical protein T492DRAFT_875686 [Pavlovales sp. CCMP2436]